MKIEVFHAPGCESCATALIELRAVAATVGYVEWREVNVLDSLDRCEPGKVRSTEASSPREA